MKVKWMLPTTLLMVTSCVITALSQEPTKKASDDFILCKSKYALCTTAKCIPVPGKNGEVSCACDVETRLFRWSAGVPGCKGNQHRAIEVALLPGQVLCSLFQ